MKKFALAGNPNSGKTTLFNTLTGSTAHVGNWPGVTVDKKDGLYKKCAEPVSIVDLPGIYSLSPYTPEEIVSRNFVIDENPDCVINIVDATNLERNLYLTTQLMEIDVPIIIALNMMDAVTKKGDTIDRETLEKKLGVPVVEISALKGQGIDELMTRAFEVSQTKRLGQTVLQKSALTHLIGDVQIVLEAQKVANPLFHAIKLVELDEIEVAMHKESVPLVEKFKDTFTDEIFGTDFEAFVADSRYRYITKNYSPTHIKADGTKKIKKTKDNVEYIDNESHSDRIDKVMTHKYFGIPIFLVILLAIFHLTFSENFLYLGGILGSDFTTFAGTAFEGVLGTGGINSPGVFLQSLMGIFMEFVTTSVGSLLAGSPTWVTGLICDGILGGLSAVLSFIPQILLLLLFFAILEDSGYMARVAFILDRIFRRFGLSGRAFIPMIMGFGCSIPAMINTRTLANENERIATIRVIPFFSCGAKLPILTAIAGGIVMQFGVGNADLITYGMYLLGIITAIVAVIVMKATTMSGETSPFIMELPTYHAPQFKNLMLLLWDKAKHFIQKAFTIILASTIVIWFVSHFNFEWAFLPNDQINNSILAGIGKLLQPIFTPLGFGSQLGSLGWVFVVGSITGLLAKENVIATFGTLAMSLVAGFTGGEEGIDAVVTMIVATGITIPALLSFIAFNMLTIPCFASVATAKAELKSEKKYHNTLLFWVLTSYSVGSMIYFIGTFWWTAFVFAALAIVAALVIRFINKMRKAKFSDITRK